MLGAGTSGDPYIVTTIEEFQSINDNLSACYKLGNNIDASDTVNWNTGYGFFPIGYNDPFTGTVDGDGYTIIDIYVGIPVTSSGVFGYIGTDGVVSDLSVSGTAHQPLGAEGLHSGFVCFNLGTVTNCHWDGDVTGAYHDVLDTPGGGFCSGNGGTIQHCSAKGTIVLDIAAGAGFCGMNQGYLIDCYSRVNVNVGGSAAGFVHTSSLGMVTDCYCAGTLAGSATGGFCYLSDTGIIYITGCYWDTTVSGVLTSDGGTGKTTVEMKKQATFAGWWFIESADYTLSVSAFSYDGANYSEVVLWYPPLGGFTPDEWRLSGLDDIDCSLYSSDVALFTAYYTHGQKANLEAAITALGVPGLVCDATSESIFTPTDTEYAYAGDPSGWAVIGTDPPTLTKGTEYDSWYITEDLTYPVFNNVPPPALISATPNYAYRSQTKDIVLVGTYLSGATVVNFGTGITNIYVVNSDSQITATITVSAGATLGVRDITVTTVGGSGTLVAGFFLYMQNIPTPVPMPLTTSISFTTGAFDSPVWESIASDIMSISIQRGRQNEMNRVETSTASLTLLNTSGNYWPDLGGTHAGYVKPLKQIQIVEKYNNVIYGLFNGLIESWTPSFIFQQGMKVPVMKITCVDVMKSFSRYLLNGVSPYPQESSGARIGRVLTAFGWTGGTILDAGQSEVQALDPVTNINTLTHIQDVANSEAGVFFFDGGGNACFHDREHRPSSFTGTTITTEDAIFGEAIWGSSAFGEDGSTYVLLQTFGNPPGAGEQKYVGIDYLMEDQYVYNDIRITNAGGLEQVAQSATSIAAYGARTLSRSGLLLTTDAEAEFWANYWLTIYKNPVSRCRTLNIYPSADADNLYPLAYGYDISQKIRIRLTEAGILGYFYIEGVTHDWTATQPQMWTTKWQLSNANDMWWILEDDTFGIYGLSTRMGF